MNASHGPSSIGLTNLSADFGAAVWATMLELAPWLLVGSVAAGILHGVLPRNFVRRQLQGGSGVLKAVVLGVPLPLCSCGVIPAGLGLRRDGASRGASIGFLTATPQTGVDSILVSASFLGWPFALFKVVAALASGLVSGWAVDALSAEESNTEASTHEHGHPRDTHPGFVDRLRMMFDHALEILRSVWRWLVFGVLLSAAIQVFVPDAWLEGLGSLGPLGAGLAALAVSLPLYVCATASVPIAAALVAGGMPAGAALVFLMAGPATNVATVGAVFQGFGGKALSIYLGTLVIFSLGAGVIFEQLVPNVAARIGAHEHGASPWALLSTFALIVLLAWFAAADLRALVRRRALPAPGAGDATAPPGVGLKIRGMTCAGCQNTVQRVLGRLPGANSVHVELDPGSAVIHGSVDLQQAIEAVEQAGFEAKSV